MNEDRDNGLVFHERDRALGLRPLTARSLLASMLLGTYPPRLPVRVLVAAAELFGIGGSACRTALSRMVTAGDLITADGWYELGPSLVERQRRQDIGRQASRLEWDGSWSTLIATVERRSPAERSETRALLVEARFAELRDGVWTRPANLASYAVTEQLLVRGWLAGRTHFEPNPDVGRLWPLTWWLETSEQLGLAVREVTPRLERGDRSELARGFVLAAATLRHFRSDPLLPDSLLPSGWPGSSLRRDYDRFDEANRRLLRGFFTESRAG